jgi:hypothetical protein
VPSSLYCFSCWWGEYTASLPVRLETVSGNGNPERALLLLSTEIAQCLPIPFENSKPDLSVPHNSTGDQSSYKLISITSIIERNPNPADLNNFGNRKKAIPLTMKISGAAL